MKKLLILFALPWLLLSCNDEVVFWEYKPFSKFSWNRFDILNFEVPVEEGKTYDFALTLQYHIHYPYDFLDANITFYTPDGETRSAEYHFKLKDKEGNWKGVTSDERNDYMDVELPIRQDFKFHKAGICKVRIENKMIRTLTPGIREAGLIAREK